MEKLFEITDDILYRLFKDIPEGFSPYSLQTKYREDDEDILKKVETKSDD